MSTTGLTAGLLLGPKRVIHLTTALIIKPQWTFANMGTFCASWLSGLLPGRSLGGIPLVAQTQPIELKSAFVPRDVQYEGPVYQMDE